MGAAISLQSWYFEGDAVWAETNYTDAGRGRLPNFYARLKAILLSSEKIPTYDQFLNGSYRRPLVNQYVYGYILITAGYKRFGEKFWATVIDDVSEFPNPWRLESAFKRASKMEFKDFYNETFENLKKEWAQKTPGEWPAKPYSEEVNAQVFGDDSYYVSWDLNNHHSIMHRSKSSETKIAEIPYSIDITRVDFSPTHAIYNELRPDWRISPVSISVRLMPSIMNCVPIGDLVKRVRRISLLSIFPMAVSESSQTSKDFIIRTSTPITREYLQQSLPRISPGESWNSISTGR
ncbi:MAG: hypothetical protein EOP07_25535 [Proteobacteria bacterium]|nr:MAG: hypothetical protein EOP07_25535 [Pseudomonadota bacterium]